MVINILMEESLMETILDLFKWLITIRKTERNEYTPPNYYKIAIESLEDVIKVSNDLLKAYKKIKL